MARESAKGRRDRLEWERITRQRIAEVGGVCQLQIKDVCTGRAVRGHHRKLRGQGGPNTPENCDPACRACHRYAHLHPKESYETGRIVRRGGGA